MMSLWVDLRGTQGFCFPGRSGWSRECVCRGSSVVYWLYEDEAISASGRNVLWAFTRKYTRDEPKDMLHRGLPIHFHRRLSTTIAPKTIDDKEKKYTDR